MMDDNAFDRRAALAQAHMPMDRRHALSQRATLPDSAVGAALFADISGFTRLTSEFAREGGRRRGPEALTETINPVYEQLITQVHAFGGSVTSFAGDAITCWFDDQLPSATVAPAVRRALTCAFAMQAAMTPFANLQTAWGVPVSLGIKVSVVAGSVRRFLVGDPASKLHDVLAGRLLERMVAANALADTGEVVVGAEVVEALGDDLEVGAWRDDEKTGERFRLAGGLTRPVEPAPWPDELVALDEAAVRPWLLAPVFNRLRTGHDLLGELRLAIPVFVQFGGIDYDEDSTAGEKLDAYARWVQGVVARYGGHLLQMTVGDKGSLALVCFGAPHAHEDDPNRAIAAALELQTPPDELTFAAKSRIGICQGQLWAGAYGARTQSCYGILGDPVNLAARQMSMAEPGSVVVSERLTQAGAGTYRFQDVGEIHVKGRSEPLLVSAVIGRRAATQRSRAADADNAMVGRAAELAQLTALLKDLADGVSGVVIIEGEAGIGKSRLIAELMERADNEGIARMMTSGDSIETATAYFAWQPIVRHALHLGPAVRAEADVKRMESRLERLGADCAEHAPLLSSLLGLDLPDTPVTEVLEARAKAEARHELVVDILRDEMRGEPLLLIFDDAHWLDSSSWSLLLEVKERLEPMLLVIGTRPMAASDTGADDLPDAFRQLAAENETHRIDLGRMNSQETLSLVAHHLHCNSLPGAVADLIIERAEGNPFFSEELGRAMRDRGIIRISDGECAIAQDAGDLSQLDLPDSIQGVITQRIDLLDPEQQLTVRVASVIGRSFERDTLGDIYPVPADSPLNPESLQEVLKGYLDKLETLDITPLESPDRPTRYMFKHALTQDVAYGLMTFAQRRGLHRAMAEWYEEHHALDLAPHLAVLAHHWERAEDTARAIEYLSRAGEQALNNFANQEAVRFIERAIAYSDRRSDLVGSAVQPVEVSALQRGRWERQLGDAHFRLGHMKESENHLRQALAQLGWPVPAEREGLGLDIGAVLGQENWRHVLAELPLVEVAAPDEEELARTRLAYQIYDHLVEVAFLNGEQDLTLYSTFKSLELAERLGPSPELAQAYAKVSFTLSFVPLHDAAQLYKKLAMDVIAPFEDPVVLASVTLPLGVYTAAIGDWDETESLMSTAGASFERIGNWQRWGFCAQIQLRAALHQGRFDEHGRLAERLLQVGTRHKNVEQQIWGLRDKGHHLLLTTDDASGAVRLLSEAIALSASGGDRAGEIMSLGLIANAHLRRGKTFEAREAADRAQEMAEAPTSFGQFTTFAATAEALLGLWANAGDSNGIAVAADRACQALEEFAELFPIGRPRALLMRGWHLDLTGETERAKARWDESLAEAERQAVDYDAALARLWLGRRLPPEDPRRAEMLVAAVETFERLGARHDLSQARTALA